jgi:8-oxo-dGTP pyrophosphatase MutT (NUDIX family)
MTTATTFDDISGALAGCTPAILGQDYRIQAAVALILREEPAGLSILFIERAARFGDPWSGDIGFPGGKVEPEDDGPLQTAKRETREELGLALWEARYLGRLSDIAGAHLPVRVSCFAFGVHDPPSLVLGHELRDAFWVPLTELFAPARHVTAPVRFGGESLERPAILLPQAGKPVLWGITYRLVMQFAELLQGKCSGSSNAIKP